jgi:cathepsin L
MSKFTALVGLSALFAPALALQPVLDGSVSLDEEFDVWAKHYGKTYNNADHREARKAIYAHARAFVIEHNQGFTDGKHSFSVELNDKADITNEEYRTQLLGLSSASSPASRAYDTFAPNGTAPASWDWRDTPNVVNPVKNQGGCGSCWAFSAVATMEGAYNLKNKALTQFSEQELVDCVNGGTSTCSVGGEMYQGVEYGISNGMMGESDYPYKGTSGGGCHFDKSKMIQKFKGYTNITSGDENALMEAAYKQPIVSVGIDASSFWFQLYFGGVYDHSGCHNKADQLDHGVAVVGYGTDPKSKKDYWWVRNSWGGSWGMKGYIQMVRNKDNQCGIATQACFATL